MGTLDIRAVRFLIVVLALVALAGFSQGLVHALAAPRPEQAAAGVDPRRDPVPNASAMTGAVVMDEARVREIAREEAQAALAAGARKKPPAAAKAEEADDDAAPAPAPAPAPPPAAPAPAPAATPAAPAPQT